MLYSFDYVYGLFAEQQLPKYVTLSLLRKLLGFTPKSQKHLTHTTRMFHPLIFVSQQTRLLSKVPYESGANQRDIILRISRNNLPRRGGSSAAYDLVDRNQV